MVQNEDNKKVNKNKGWNYIKKLVNFRGVDAVQGLHFSHRKAGGDGMTCRAAGGGSLFHMDTVLI